MEGKKACLLQEFLGKLTKLGMISTKRVMNVQSLRCTLCPADDCIELTLSTPGLGKEGGGGGGADSAHSDFEPE